jgi:hypothetical protein
VGSKKRKRRDKRGGGEQYLQKYKNKYILPFCSIFLIAMVFSGSWSACHDGSIPTCKESKIKCKKIIF